MLFRDILLVGTYYRGPEAVAYVSALNPGDKLRVEREPTNPHDELAIKILSWAETPGHIGYVKGTDAAWIAPQLDEEEPDHEGPSDAYIAVVEELLVHKGNTYAKIRIEPKIADHNEA